MAGSDRLMTTIESIYAAGVDEARWPAALLATAHFTGSLAATFEVFDKRQVKLDDFRVAGLPPQAEMDYLAHYARNNPRASYAFAHLSEEILTDYQILDERAMDRNAYYAKYLSPIDLRYFLSAQIFNNPRQQAVITIQRTRRQGHVGRAETDGIRRLLPHFRRAHDMAVRLRTAGGSGALVEGAIDWLADGVVLLRADGKLVHANAAMMDLAAGGDGIRLSSRGLEFAGPAERTLFEAALAALTRLRAGDAASAAVDFAARRPSGAPAYVVSVRPLVGGSNARKATSPADVVVFVHDPLTRNPVSGDVLRAAFGLTEAEADLALALQAGTSPTDYARKRAVSVNTVYTHLRRTKEKTGTTRIADLINRLNTVRMPLRGD